MTPDEFEAGLDRWGGALEDWPAPDRSAAQALLRDSAVAREALRAMLAVEAALARSAARPPAGLDDLLARATAQPQERPAKFAWRVRYAVCAAALAAGFAYGALAQAAAPEDWFSQAFAPPEALDVN
jgi:hypothetical protein